MNAAANTPLLNAAQAGVQMALGGSGSSAFDDATITPHRRPSTTIGAPTDERKPRSRSAPARAPDACS